MRSTLLIIMLDFFVSSLMLFINVGDGVQSSHFGNGKPLVEIRNEAQSLQETSAINKEITSYFDEIEKIQSLTIQNKILESENIAMLDDVKVAREDKNKEVNERQILAMENTRLRNVNSNIEEENKEKDKRIEALNEENKELFYKNDKISEQLNDKQQQLEIAKQDKAVAHERLAESSARETELQKRNEQANKAKEEAQKQYIEEKAKRENAEKELTLAQNRISQLEQEKLGHEQLQKTVQEGFAASEARIKDVKEGQQKGFGDTKAQLEGVQAGLGNIKERVASVQEGQTEIKAQMAQMQRWLEQDMARRKEENAKLARENQAFLQRMFDQQKTELAKQYQLVLQKVEEANAKANDITQQLQDAVAKQDKQLAEKLQAALDEALKNLGNMQAEANFLGNANTLSQESKATSIPEARVQLNFALRDNCDTWSPFCKRDRGSFNSYAIAVQDGQGQKMLLVHQERLGLSWNQYDDGLSEARLQWRTREPFASDTFSHFSSLAVEPQIIKIAFPQATSVIKLYASPREHSINTSVATARTLTRLPHENLYSPKPAEGVPHVSGENLHFDSSWWGGDLEAGDFILDDNNHLVCIMITDSQCRMITQTDLIGEDEDFAIYPLYEFASQALKYSKRRR